MLWKRQEEEENFFPHGRNSEQIQAAHQVERSSAVNTDGLEGKYIGRVTVKITATEITVKIYRTETKASAGGAGEGDILYTINDQLFMSTMGSKRQHKHSANPILAQNGPCVHLFEVAAP